jgi:uncharacterized repeat protein (TIGR03803 family)
MRKLSAFTLAVLVFLAGIAFRAARAQTFSVLYNFGSHNGDPWNPQWSGIIAQGQDGNLYSTAPQDGDGSVFSISPGGTLKVVYAFSGGSDGLSPSGGLSLGTDGNFYGTTSGGGFAPGTIFKVTPSGTLMTLYTFTNGLDGSDPTAPPIEGLDGNYYGTAANGNQGQGFYGSVYKITPSGTFTTLRSLDINDGAFPEDPLVQSTKGILYGTTEAGTSNNEGDTFSITSSGKFKAMFKFDGTHGANPSAPLIQATDGNFYGTTKVGGANNLGEVFKSSASGKITILYSFTGNGDGAIPNGGLVQASDGNFYGTTSMATGTSGCGTIFRISPKGAFATLFTFLSDGSLGCNPLTTLAQHTNGVLYGDTNGGGTGTHGVFFSLNAALKPFVSLAPIIGKVGDTIEFLGQGFTGTTVVSFGGTSATFQVVSDTYLTATVPSGAKTGSVTVTTPGREIGQQQEIPGHSQD